MKPADLEQMVKIQGLQLEELYLGKQTASEGDASAIDKLTPPAGAARTSQLKSLALTGWKLQEKDFTAIAQLKTLTNLHLIGCSVSSYEHMNVLKKWNPGNPRTLALIGWEKTEPNLFMVINDLGFADLQLSECRNFSALALEQLASKTLTSLDLSWCEQVKKEHLLALSGLPGLTEINLAWCHQLTDTDLEAFAKFQKLHTIRVRGCARLTSGCVTYLGDGWVYEPEGKQPLVISHPARKPKKP